MNEPKYDEFAALITAAIQKRIDRSPTFLSWNHGGKLGATEKIKSNYEECRAQMKKRMAQHSGQGTDWNDQVLDRHKIASAVCWAIALAQPIYAKGTPSGNDRIANEICAFNAPLQLLLSFAADDADKVGDTTKAAFFRRGPSLPPTQDGTAFTVHVARTLYWRRVMNTGSETSIDKGIDPFQLAVMFYMLELFTSLDAQAKLVTLTAGVS